MTQRKKPTASKRRARSKRAAMVSRDFARKKPKAWEGSTAVLHPDGVLELFGGAMRHVREEAAKTPGARALMVVEADPAAAAVVRAAVRWFWHMDAGDLGEQQAKEALAEAIEKLQRKGKR